METTQHIVLCEADANLLLHNSVKSYFNTLKVTIKPVEKSQTKIDAPAKAKAPLCKPQPKKFY